MTKADIGDSSRQAEADRDAFVRQHQALLRLSADLAASLDEVEICQSIVHGLHDLQGYDYVGLFLVDASTGDRVLRASIGWADAPPDYRLSPGHGLSERPLLDGQLHYTSDVTQSRRYLPGIRGGTELDVPLRVGEKVVGVLVVESEQIDAFDQDDFAVATAAANQAAVALGRAREHQAMQAAELRYQGLFGRVPMGLYRTTPAGRFLDANPAMVEALGYPDRESLLAINSADLYVDPKERQRWQALLEREQLVRGFEAQLLRHDGTIIWMRDTSRAVCDAEGQVLYYEGSLEDITERKQTEDRLRFLSSAVEQSSEGIAVVDLAGHLLFVNNAFAAMHGYALAELVGEHLAIFHTPEQMPAVDAANRQIQEEGEFTGEIWHVRRDGVVFPTLMHNSLLRDEAGTAIGMIGTIRDISDRKRAQEALQHSEAQYRALVEQSLQGIVIVQALPLSLVFANPAACEMLGLTVEELTTLTPQEIEELLHPDDRLDLLQRVADLGEENPPRAPSAARVFRKDGTMRWIEVLGWETEYDGSPAFQVSMMDVTERMEAEEAMRESEERYRRLFEESPICLWEEDFSAVKAYLDRLRAEGIDDFRSHLENHPEIVVQCADMVKVLDVNQAAMELYQVEDRDSLRGALATTFPPEGYGSFRGELVAIAEGKTWFEGDVVTICLAGEQKHTLTRWTVASGHRETLSRVLVSVIDITDRIQAEEEIQQRTAQLEALRVVGLELAAKLNLEDLLHSIVSHAVELLGETSGGLYLYRPELDTLEWTVSVGTSQVPIGSHLGRGEGLSGKVWQTGEPLIVHDYRHWEGRATTFDDFEWAAVVGAPVRWGDEFLGVLNVEGQAPGAFQPADAELLSLFATQAAIAIKNARLFEAERAARERAETLQAATQALSATLDLQQVFELILSELRRVVPYDSASVQALKGDRLEIIGGHGFPNLEELLGETFDLMADDNPNREVTSSRVPLVLEDAPTVYTGFHREPHVQAGIRSWLGVPLLFGDRLLGMIALDKQEPGFYTDDHAFLALAFAAQAAIAIENARLFETAQQNVAELEAVRQASLGLTSRLDLSAVLEAILKGTFKLLTEATNAHVYLYRQGQLTFGAALWSHGRKGQSLPFPRAHGLTYTVARQGRLIAVPDLRSHPLYADAPQDWKGAIVGLPLKIGQRVVGVMNVAVQRPHDWADTELRLLRLLGDQAAIAIENARLFQAEREQRELAEALGQATSAVSSTLDLEQILDYILEQVDRVIPNDAVNVNLIEGDRARMVRWRGYERLGQGVQSVVLSVSNTPTLRRMKETGEVMVISDLASYPDWVVVPEVAWIRSYAAAPIRGRDQVIGFLNVDSATPGFFDQAHADRLRAFADQVGLAIENARLYEETRRQNRELALLNRVIAASASGQRIETILETVCRELALAYGVPQAAAVLLNDERTEAAVVAEYRDEGDGHPGGDSARRRQPRLPILDPAQSAAGGRQRPNRSAPGIHPRPDAPAGHRLAAHAAPHRRGRGR